MPLNVIQVPTNVSNNGAAQDPHITALSNGGYALTYSTEVDAVSAVFDAQGQQIASNAVDQAFINSTSSHARQ